MGEGGDASTLILQPSFSHQKPAQRRKNPLSQLLFLQLGSDQLPKCVPGASLSLNCLFYWSTDHIWKSLGGQRSPIACTALMRARARDAAASPAPRVPPCPSCCLGRSFLQRQELISPLVFPVPPPRPNPWHIFHLKPNPCTSHHCPATSGVQREGLNPDVGPDALTGG